jgi:hypothetical protein
LLRRLGSAALDGVFRYPQAQPPLLIAGLAAVQVGHVGSWIILKLSDRTLPGDAAGAPRGDAADRR